MSDVRGVAHFHNQAGSESIRIGFKEFMCIGALPPFDHPHVFLDMGSGDEAICPYCATLYKHDPKLAGDASEPSGAGWSHNKAA